MNTPKSTSLIVIAILVLLTSVPAYTQSSMLSTVPEPAGITEYEKENLVASQTVSAAVPQNADEDAVDNDFGSLSGRVFYDAVPGGEPQTAKSAPIGGVKVKLRRVDGRFGNFLFERVSAADGIYDFQYLRPGRYTVEVDGATMPADIPLPAIKTVLVDVALARRSHFDLYIAPRREVAGTVFVDVDGDGKYKPGKDKPLAGVSVTAGGSLAVSDANGSYVLRDLPAGRLGLLINSPINNESSHVILDLGSGPVTKRIVNVPLNR